MVCLPDGGKVTVDVSAAEEDLVVEWFDPTHGKVVAAGVVQDGGPREFKAPFAGPAVLYLKARGAANR